jgi:DNA-binding LacI/PurR family transcriptional regulator
VISAIINENWKEKRISQATYDRITKQMHEIGFVPNRTAISLKKNKKDRIGILCHGPLYSHTFHSTGKTKSLLSQFPEVG